jgi:hypothetical protein
MRSKLAGTLVALTALATTSRAAAQPSPDAVDPGALQRDTFLDRSDTANAILGGWSAASIAVGTIMLAASDDPFVENMAIQHVVWGGIDALIVGITSIVLQQQRTEQVDRQTWIDRRNTAQTVFWVNAGLDLAYMATGAAIWLFSQDDKWKGAGSGILLQGGFLLGFDTGSAIMMGTDP